MVGEPQNKIRCFPRNCKSSWPGSVRVHCRPDNWLLLMAFDSAVSFYDRYPVGIVILWHARFPPYSTYPFFGYHVNPFQLLSGFLSRISLIHSRNPTTSRDSLLLNRSEPSTTGLDRGVPLSTASHSSRVNAYISMSGSLIETNSEADRDIGTIT